MYRTHSYSSREPRDASSTYSDHISSIGSTRTARSRATTNTSYGTPSDYGIPEQPKEVQSSMYEYIVDNDDAVSPTISPRDSTSSLSSSVSTHSASLPSGSENSLGRSEDESSENIGAIASTPRNFATYFPTTNRMTICHDDTLDGNMNLRLDTTMYSRNGERKQLTLFHLRMSDLKTRDFSLRRYCRDSGREMCHSIRKELQQPPNELLNIREYVSNALSSLRRFSQPVSPSRPSSSWTHASNDDEMEEFDAEDQVLPHSLRPQLSKTVSLEFSNYTHIDVTPRGRDPSRRTYTFEYWGLKYTWKKSVIRTGEFSETSFHLFRDDEEIPLAHIVPFAMTRAQAEEERRMGGWVNPCSMWIADERIVDYLPDVADVVVATGLIALVDDSIKTTWPAPRRRTFTIPIFSSQSSRDQGRTRQDMTPRRLIDEIFNRDTISAR